MPSELKEIVDDAAASAGRSINSEIVDRLRRSFDHAGGDLASVPDSVLVDEIIRRYAERKVRLVITVDTNGD